ncbi:helix-turn-helix domain-containing protein [Pseudoalteromonas sp.]|uniref:helix-turn-helix domain-containing protein n=1 Tax=Pseudoalteromonas sp. TaxID=53249 RepID=UPI00235454DB|nr:helix-turn-helix domain-containing protein [Pseudoalteromonas sp.]
MSLPINLANNNESWIGSSDALFQLKNEINKLASSILPIHIVGEPGTGKQFAAQKIHQLSNKEGSFIMSCCTHWTANNVLNEFDTLISQLKKGTIYLKNIDSLSCEQFDVIKDYWLNEITDKEAVRLITSTTPQKQTAALQLTDPATPLDWLHYHCLGLLIPTLSQREEDIIAFIETYQLTDKNIAQLTFSSSAIAILKSYRWPNNVKQLKRCLDKLTFLNDYQEINAQTLTHIFPSMASAPSSHNTEIVEVTPPSPLLAYNFHQDITELHTNILLTEHTHCQTTPAIKNKPHPALQRALQHIDENYTKPLSLSEVANCACVSPSHLSFLFKRYVGQSFKQTLLRLRIKTAMTLLREDPYCQVTEVCDDVGFSDLSFFVRKFKAVVGVSPGVYRDQRAKH